MPSLLLEAKDLESYIPAIDARRLAKPAVIKGKNFIFDVDGPRSAFATTFANWYQFDISAKRNVREFRVNGRYFYGTPVGIWEIDETSFLPTLLLPITTLKPWWPWTFAQVGNLFYFAQHDVGLWQYNDITKIWKKVELPLGAVARGVCASYFRLLVLSDELIFISAQDDGTDFAPSLTTGAGFQPLSILSQKAYRIDPVSDGVIISTDKGWIKGEYVPANYVFRWYVLSRAVFLFSPNMGTVIPDVGLVVLDTNGFHVSDGKLPQVWEPLHGKYLQDKFLKGMDRSRHGCCQLYYSHAEQRLYVSIAPNMKEGTFTNTTVYDVGATKWGIFDRPHHGIFEVTKMPYRIDVAAYMDLFGFMEQFSAVNNREQIPSGGNFYGVTWRQVPEPPVLIQVDEDNNKVFVGISEFLFNDNPPNVFGSLPTGLYEVVEIDYDETSTIPESDIDPEWSLEVEA